MCITDSSLKSDSHYIKDILTIKEELFLGGDPLRLDHNRIEEFLFDLSESMRSPSPCPEDKQLFSCFFTHSLASMVS